MQQESTTQWRSFVWVLSLDFWSFVIQPTKGSVNRFSKIPYRDFRELPRGTDTPWHLPFGGQESWHRDASISSPSQF